MSPLRQRFAQLLAGAVNAAAAFERKSTRAVAQELGEAIGRTYHTIENYKSAKATPTDAAQVRALATFGVVRARLNASWLREFLTCLSYADPDALIAELCGPHWRRRRLARQLRPRPGTTTSRPRLMAAS